MTDYVPATFDLYEFDDSEGGQVGPARRWLDHWDGLIGHPAEEVTLGWAAGQVVAVVCTSGRHYTDADARRRAAHLVFGGITLPVPHRPADAGAAQRQMEMLCSTPSLWYSPGGSVGQGHTTLVEGPGFTTGYRLLDCGAVFIAATHLPPDQLRTRPVHDWATYDVDATTRFPLSALHRSGMA